MSLPGAELTTADLARWCYPRSIGEPDWHQRRAIVRAAERVATRVRRDRPGGVVSGYWIAKPLAIRRLLQAILSLLNSLADDRHRFVHSVA
jgi:hypothetical protein